jgi:PIN domain nuclease of toxin-antitoxin system
LILLDTHALVWSVLQSRRLSRTAASAIRRGRTGGGIGISAITLWELASLFARGQIQASGTIENSIQAMIDTAGVSVHPLTPTVTALAAIFPEDYPRDPADRLIGGTARAEGVPLVTGDERIRRSTLIKTIW